MTTFSIIMPVYNAEKYLNRSINSILNQTVADFEFIAVDDGSTDESLEVLRKYAELDKRVNIITQSNSGPGIARNNGIKKSKGTYIAFLDADDYWEPDFLEEVLRKVKTEKSDLVYVETLLEREDKTIIKDIKPYRHEGDNKDMLLRKQLIGELPWGMSKVMRRDLFDSANIGFLNLKVGEELLLSFELLKKATSVGFIHKPIYHYVQNSEGQHTKGSYDPWKEMLTVIRAYLASLGELQTYHEELNMLALKALGIAIYRYSCEFGYKEAKNSIKKIVYEYNSKFELSDVNKNMIGRSQLTIKWLIDHKMWFMLYTASIVRRKRMRYGRRL